MQSSAYFGWNGPQMYHWYSPNSKAVDNTVFPEPKEMEISQFDEKDSLQDWFPELEKAAVQYKYSPSSFKWNAEWLNKNFNLKGFYYDLHGIKIGTETLYDIPLFKRNHNAVKFIFSSKNFGEALSRHFHKICEIFRSKMYIFHTTRAKIYEASPYNVEIPKDNIAVRQSSMTQLEVEVKIPKSCFTTGGVHGYFGFCLASGTTDPHPQVFLEDVLIIATFKTDAGSHDMDDWLLSQANQKHMFRTAWWNPHFNEHLQRIKGVT